MNLGRLARFGVVGVLNTAIYYGAYLGLRRLVEYMVAHVIAFVTAMVCSYFLNCYITFRTAPRWRTFLMFPLSTVASFVVTTVGLRVAVEFGGLGQRIAPLIVAGAGIPVTYVITHYIMIGRLRDPLRASVGAPAGERDVSAG
jgi:putative flippase GtrA